ncbi:MAG: hypothetical protein HYR60_29145 [Acidobacteria bacterium]|nr:hypothetical protein [Acidobacteriota bacterium]
MQHSQPIKKYFALAAVAALMLTASFAFANGHEQHKTSAFMGPKANTGFAMHYREGNKSILEVSPDFVIPDTPAPHWQVVTSKGDRYLLKNLKVKPGLNNRKIEVPHYVGDIAKVEIWCSFAEALLGEASFAKPVK